MTSRFRRYTLKEAGLAFAFLAPSLIIFTVFFYLPFFRLVDWGRYKSERGGLSYRYVGLQQYRDILTGPEFTDGLKHSVLFVLYTVPAGLVLGVLLAARH